MKADNLFDSLSALNKSVSNLASKIDVLKQDNRTQISLLIEALDALIHHQEMTRPIAGTQSTINNIKKYLESKA